jgi:hypothetical protein
MRMSLFAAAATAPLLWLAASGPVLAETQITTSQTAPVATSTANGGAPDDVAIATGGSINPTSPGAAATLDSNNTLTNAGSITFKDVDNATGILIKGGNTGALTGGGSISLTESYTASDTNGDGVPDGAYAEGTGRYGVRLTGPGAFTGDVNLSGGSITVNGNNSYGVSTEAPLVGDLISGAGISMTGDNTYGIRETGGVSGAFKIDGGVAANGGGATGVDVAGPVGGRLSVYSAVGSTGYRVTQRSNNPAFAAGLLPENILQAGSALSIRADIGGGVFIGAPPVGTSVNDATTDADGDGIVDSLEGTGALTTFGSAPALSIGQTGATVHLGQFGTGENGHGLIVRGSVTGNGVYDGVPATAIQIGAAGGVVNIDGGYRNVGGVTATAYGANAVGVLVKSGATVPQILNSGGFNSSVASATASTSTALQIDAGASVSSLDNSGGISASATGDAASAYAVVDRSGSLTSIINNNTIAAATAPAVFGNLTTGQAIALDLRANTTGVSLVQNPSPGVTTATTDSAGNVTLTVNPVSPVIRGDILLGSGSDMVAVHAGNVYGALDFGAGPGTLTIDGGAAYLGALTSSGPLAVNVTNGVLTETAANTFSSPSLTVGDGGQLVFTADPANGRFTRFNVTGPAVIAPGAKLGINLSSLPTTSETFTAIQASTLTVGVADADLGGQVPYLFAAGFHSDPAAGTVDFTLRRRTAAELGFNAAETAAYDGVYNAIDKDSGVLRSVLAQTDQAGLRGIYDQMMPDYSGGVFRTLSWAADAQGRAAAEAPQGQSGSGPTRAWSQEIAMREDKKPNQSVGYRTLGIGIVGGLESVSPRGDALGVKLGFVTAQINQPDLPGDNLLGVSQINTGVYWRGTYGPLSLDAQLGAGYVWVTNRREFLYSDALGVVHRVAKGSWNGYTLSGRIGAAYLQNFGRMFLEPRVHADYLRIHENGYSETGGGDAFDLIVNGRNSDAATVSASVVAGVNLGQSGFRWRPQIEVGYRSVLTGGPGRTTAAFTGGDPFTVATDSLTGGALVGTLGLRVYSDYLDLLFEVGAEKASDYTDYDLRMTARTVF